MNVPVSFAVSAALAAFLLLLPSTTCRGAPGDLYVGDGSDILMFSSNGTKTTF
jgi:hypothetical protein